MALVAWTPDDEENWQQMMQTVAQRRRKLEPQPQTSQANNVSSATDANPWQKAFAGGRRPDVSQGMAEASGAELARRKGPGLSGTAAAYPSAPLGVNHQDTELADISAQDDQRYEAMKQQKYRGVAPSKNDQIWAKAYEKRKSLGPAASVPEADQSPGLPAPRMEGGITQSQPGIPPRTDMATTGLGQAGMRAYAKWQGLNPDLQSSAGGPAGLADTQLSRPRPSSFPQPGGYDATLAARPQVSTGTYGQRGVSNQDGSPPTFARPGMQSDQDYVEAIKRRGALEGLAGLYGVNRQLLGQAFETANRLKPSTQVEPDSLMAADRRPTMTPMAWHPPQQGGPGGQRSPGQAVPQNSDVPVPYPLHGWNFVSPEDRQKLEDMRRSGNRAGVDAYAKEVADKAYRDHPVEMWLPFGPNMPGTREKVKDVDRLEHSGEWAHVSPQERAGLASLLAKGQMEEANQYARKLNSDIQARLVKRSLDARPEPPGLAPEFWDTAKINKLRGYQAANIITNEDRDVLPGPSTLEDLQKARVAQAHAIINADRNLGDARQGLVRTAPSEIKDRKLANSEQYRQALNAVRTAREEDLRGIDPTGGRMPFNNRYNTLDKGKRKIGSERVNLHQPYGPFVWGKTPTYVMLYDNTQDELRRIERMKKKEKK